MVILGIADKQGDVPAYAYLKDGDITVTADNLQNMPQAPDIVAYYKKPFLELARVIETHIAYAPRTFQRFRRDLPGLCRKAVTLRQELCTGIHTAWPGTNLNALRKTMLFSDEQLSLCAQAFYPTPYEEAVVLCLDDAGEWGCSSIAVGRGADLVIEQEIVYPHSLGLFLDAFCEYLGVERAGLYTLADTGDPTYARMLGRNVIDIKPDGSYAVNQAFFGYAYGEAMTGSALHDLLGGGPRASETIDQRHRNIAASVAALVMQAASYTVRYLSREYRGLHTLCVTGEVACAPPVRERIVQDHSFDRVTFSAVGGNKALASGAALAAYYIHQKHPRDVMFLQRAYNRVR